jgi:hypothetical protein
MTGEPDGHEEVLAGGNVLQSAAAKLRERFAFIERRAAAGDAAREAVLARGDVVIYRRDIAHIQQLAAPARTARIVNPGCG